MSEDFTVIESANADAAPVFVLSFRQRDEVAAAAAGGGWRVVAARRSDALERRFLSSGAAVAVIDARGALSEGMEAAKVLGPTIELRPALPHWPAFGAVTAAGFRLYPGGATYRSAPV